MSVAPYLGAWIEILNLVHFVLYIIVAPYLGAWIEIFLKWSERLFLFVAPYLGAWIEISNLSNPSFDLLV